MLGIESVMDLTQKFYITVGIALISFLAGIYVKQRNDKSRLKCKWDDMLYKALIFQSLAVQTLFSSYSVNVANEAARIAASRARPVSEIPLYESYATVTLSGGRTVTYHRQVPSAEGRSAICNTRDGEGGTVGWRTPLEPERLLGSHVVY